MKALQQIWDWAFSTKKPPPVFYVAPEDVARAIDSLMPSAPSGIRSLEDVVGTVLRHSVATSDYRFMNSIPTGLRETGLAADVLASALHATMATSESAPLLTELEKRLVRMLLDKFGFKSGNGTFVPGGSYANWMALVCARHFLIPEAKSRGLDGRQLVIFVSESVHYSVFNAANITGIGVDNVIKVSDPNALRVAIEIAKSAGKVPVCIISTAGTTTSGTIDPLEEISKIAKEHKIWHHVDAAWAGGLVFSSTHRHLLAGISQADSIGWDAHKQLGVPLSCSAFLTPHNILANVVSTENADYLFHDPNAEDLGRLSFQCGRRADMLKLWLTWYFYGDSGLEKIVDRAVELARFAASVIESHSTLSLVEKPETFAVCFRFSDEKKNKQLIEIRETLRQQNSLFINYVTVTDKPVFRLVTTHPAITESGIQEIIEEIGSC